MSQSKLGGEINLTFQQIQKYERGTNRVGASRLYQLSQVLNVPVSFFFDDMPLEVRGAAPGLGKTPGSRGGDMLSKRETLELIRAYHSISDASVRRRVYDLVKSLGAHT
jgi:transcriptional regulator with XRE-family HTH domain